MRHRLAKIAGATAACALALGMVTVVGGQAASAKSSNVNYKTVGFAAGTIGDDGSFTATVAGTGANGATSSATITGQLATGSGTGQRGASGSAALTEDSFSSSFSSKQRSTSGPDATGTISGTVSPAPDTTVAININYNFTCTVSYPPLAVQCSVVLKWSAPAA
ncbi:MAG: hypothetical protein ABSF84_13350 [Acidimicrobiales bacterium]